MSLQNAQVEFAELIISSEDISDGLKPVANVKIYQKHYIAHLTKALVGHYPLLVKLLGEMTFKNIAKDYIACYPSTSGNLEDYGWYFSDFIRVYEPTAHLPYLPDVATYESISHSLHQASDIISFNPNLLKNIPIEKYAKLQFVLNTSCAIHQFNYPIMDIIELCHEKIDKIDQLTQIPHYLLMHRCVGDIKVTVLTLAEFTFLDAIQHNMTLETALQMCLAVDAEFDLNRKLSDWIKNNTIVDFILTN